MTEYRREFENQTKPFATQIRYLELAKIASLIAEWIGDFILYTTAESDQWEDKVRQKC